MVFRLPEEKSSTLSSLAEGTSVGRATAFNETAVKEFFNNLESFIDIEPAKIYNVYETGISTVAKLPKILAQRGKARVALGTSGERGTNTTVVCCMSATESYVPPMFIFKRMRMAQHLMNGSPVGSIGECSESGWVNENLFVKWLHHFQSFTGCSPENPVLLIADNHSSHISLEIFEFVRKNGIRYVTIPPKTSHRLQPLDVSFFKPLKTNYAEQVRLWLLQNSGHVVTTSQVAEIFSKAYVSTCRMELAMSGFSATGISPFNRYIFQPEDFIAAEDDDAVETGDSSSQQSQHAGAASTGASSRSATSNAGAASSSASSRSATFNAGAASSSASSRSANFNAGAASSSASSRSANFNAGAASTSSSSRSATFNAGAASSSASSRGLTFNAGAASSSASSRSATFNAGAFYRSTASNAGAASTSAASTANIESIINKISPKRTFGSSKKKRNTGNKSRKRQSIILHASPMKAILEKKSKKKREKMTALNAARASSSSSKCPPKKRKLTMPTEPVQAFPDDEDKNTCIVCSEHFNNSNPGEQWVKCCLCGGWAHDACTPGYSVYICHNCED